MSHSQSRPQDINNPDLEFGSPAEHDLGTQQPSSILIALMFRIPAIDVHLHPPNRFQVPPEGQPGESNLSDGSGAVFTMYLDLAEEEDIKMAERWKGDADGMLVFVGLRPTSHNFALNVENADRCVLCCRRSVARGDYPRYSTELAGHLGVLSLQLFLSNFPS